jgi:F-box protein 11
MKKNPIAFFSYVRLNDEQDDGRLTELRKRLEREVEVQTGDPFQIFQDRNDIKWGQQWKQRIEGGIDGSTFLIAVVTPSYLNSDACRDEFDRFLEREKKLKRNDLILPLFYVDTPAITNEKKRKGIHIAEEIAKRQWADWRDLRHEPWTSADIGKRLAAIASQIRDAIERGADKQPSPPKRRKRTEKISAAISATSSEQGQIEAGKVKEDRSESRNEPKTWVVDPFPNRGDFQTISAAIQNASAGQRVLIRPGLYREAIVLEKPLEIIGDGPREEIIIEANNRRTLDFKTDFGRVANITLRQSGGDHFCVGIGQGRLDLDGCDISSQTQACVGIYGGADPRIRRSRIHDSKSGGLYIYENGKGTIEDNDIFGNALPGVSITTGGDPTLRRNRIHDGKQNGVHVFKNGKGTIEDNDIFGNMFPSVAITTGGDPTLRRNRIHDGKQNGVFVTDNGKGTIEDNDIFDNGSAGVTITKGGDPTLRRNRIHDGKQNGVFVSEDGKGTIEDNNIFGNTFAGVAITKGGDPTLRRNRIHDGKQSGVFVKEKGKGTIEDNQITGNANSGVRILTSEESLVRNNKINTNSEYGVSVGDNSGGVFESNDLTGNKKGPWKILESSKAKIKSIGNIE